MHTRTSRCTASRQTKQNDCGFRKSTI
jgi:hypothetical protein